MCETPFEFHIIVPLYKVERYLEACLQSLRRQTYPRFTAYLVDDGSPDRCGEICDRWAVEDPRFRVIHTANRGVFHARCSAIEAAGSDGYAVFLDGDDTLKPHALETVAAAIETHSCDCVIYGAERMLDGRSIQRLTVPAEEPLVLTDKGALYRIIMLDELGSYRPLWRKAVRMDVLKGKDHSADYHIRIGEDRLHSLDIYRGCRRFCFLPDTLYEYRLNPDSVTQTVRYENYRVDYTVLERECRFLAAEPAFTEADMARYRSFCIRNVMGYVVDIGLMDTASRNKKALYRTIQDTAYWKDFIGNGSYDRAVVGRIAVVYETFRRRKFRLVLLLTAIYRRLLR